MIVLWQLDRALPIHDPHLHRVLASLGQLLHGSLENTEVAENTKVMQKPCKSHKKLYKNQTTSVAANVVAWLIRS